MCVLLLYIKILIKKGFDLIMPQIVNGQEVSSVAYFYAYMIMEGKTTFARCPKVLKEDCAFVLVVLDCEYLITDEQYKKGAIDRNNGDN